MKYLVTGAAGFIGFHVAKRLLKEGDLVVGIDNLNNYYDVSLKLSRLEELGVQTENLESQNKSLKFYKNDLEDYDAMLKIFQEHQFDYVIHLGAQAGVRFSLEQPKRYVDSNIHGTLSLLEAARANPVKHFIYASSSSVYGLNLNIPFSTADSVDHPISLYAATKRADELMAHTYSHLFGIPVTGLRFFTVYGPWGRPDMALFMFTKNVLEKKPIDVFNNGDMSRDFTYINDIVEAIYRLRDRAPERNAGIESPDKANAPFRIYNIGNSSPVNLMDFIKAIEAKTGISAEINYKPMQAGDIHKTYADVEDLFSLLEFKPKTSIEDGVSQFVDWYKSFYKV